MSPRKITMIGGSESQKELFRAAIPTIFDIKYLNLQQELLLESDTACIFIAFRNDLKLLFQKIRLLKKKYPKIPIAVIASGLESKQVIELFRFGVSDILDFPLKLEDINRIMQHAPVKERSWWSKLINIFHRTKDSADTPIPITERKFAKRQQDIQAHFFGHFNMDINGRKFDKPKGRKINALLAFLIHNRHKNIHKELIMEKFWGDSTPSSARNSLNVAIHNLRKELEHVLPQHELILFYDDGYQLNPETKIYTDAQDFSELWKVGKNMESAGGLAKAVNMYDQAIDLYQGDFLEEMRYEDWFSSERDSLREIYLMLMDRKSNYFLDQSDFHQVITICQKMLQKDQCLEDIHRRLMTSYYALGLKDMAVKQYIKCCETMEQELASAPSDETVELYKKILKGGQRTVRV